MPVTPVLPGDMEGLRLVRADAQRVTHPLFVIVKPRKRDSDVEGSFVAKARTSGGKCLFLMPVKKDEAGRDVRAQLDAVIAGR